MISAIATLGSTIVSGITQHFKNKQEIKKAVTENRIRLAQAEQSHNHEWEMAQLEDRGWKDDVLFYTMIAMFVWAGFDPEGAEQFFKNLSMLPDWFVKTWFWVVASVLGVKKVGDYAPGAIKSIRSALGKD